MYGEGFRKRGEQGRQSGRDREMVRNAEERREEKRTAKGERKENAERSGALAAPSSSLLDRLSRLDLEVGLTAWAGGDGGGTHAIHENEGRGRGEKQGVSGTNETRPKESGGMRSRESGRTGP